MICVIITSLVAVQDDPQYETQETKSDAILMTFLDLAISRSPTTSRRPKYVGIVTSYSVVTSVRSRWRASGFDVDLTRRQTSGQGDRASEQRQGRQAYQPFRRVFIAIRAYLLGQTHRICGTEPVELQDTPLDGFVQFFFETGGSAQASYFVRWLVAT